MQANNSLAGKSANCLPEPADKREGLADKQNREKPGDDFRENGGENICGWDICKKQEKGSTMCEINETMEG